ncbi:hypothetical protein LVJ94_41425 [Pendulispora rubella]|uniref:Lipoprotein n=1 Tax=Pendulispora rubella TaxID=2741070 RepID=A0ABZ2KXC7_9BACT
MTRRRIVRLAMLAGVGSLAAALGCTSILGLDETRLRDDSAGDGGPDARQDGSEPIGDAKSDAPVLPTGCVARSDDADAGDPSAFFVQKTTGYAGPDASYVRCTVGALEPSAIQVYVLTNAGFRGPLQNGARVDGGVRFDAPPEGDRYVLDGADRRLYVVQGHRLDIGTDVLGRPDAVPASGEKLTVTETTSSSGGVTWKIGGSVSSGIAAPTGTPRTWAFTLPNGASLLDGKRGDVAWLLGTKPDNSIGGEKVAEACALSDSLQMKAKDTTSAQVGCTTVPLRKTRVGITHQSLEKCLPNRTSERDSLTFDVWPQSPESLHPVYASGRGDGPLPENSRLYRGPLTRPNTSEYDVEFLVPAPPKWALIGEARTFVAHPVRRTDGSNSPRAWEDSVTSTQAVTNPYTVNWLAPAAAAKVTLNGNDVLANPVTGATRTPTIAIAPSTNSSCSDPKGYRITIVDSETANRRYEIITTAPTVTLLDGMLENDKEYVLLTTTRYAEAYSQEEPWRAKLRTGYAVVTSHAFKP